MVVCNLLFDKGFFSFCVFKIFIMLRMILLLLIWCCIVYVVWNRMLLCFFLWMSLLVLGVDSDVVFFGKSFFRFFGKFVGVFFLVGN